MNTGFHKKIFLNLFPFNCHRFLGSSILILGAALTSISSYATSDLADNDSDPSEIEGEALAFSQSEIRQTVRHGLGVSLINSTPWTTYGVIGVAPVWEDFLGSAQLSFGESTHQGEFSGSHYEHTVKATAINGGLIYSFTDSLPFFASAGAGITYWDSAANVQNGKNAMPYKSTRDDLGFFVSSGLGMSWITQKEWMINLQLLNLSASAKIFDMGSSGDGGMKGRMLDNLNSRIFNFSFNFILAKFF